MLLLILIQVALLFKVNTAANHTQIEPWIISFTADGETPAIYVDQGWDVILNCDVNHDEFINRTQIIGPYLTNQTSTVDEKEATIQNVGCDAGRYYCLTDTEGLNINVEVKDYVDVNVRCQLQVKSPHEISRNDTPLLRYCDQQRISVSFEVYGFPEPKEFILKRYTEENLLDMDNELYVVSFKCLTPPTYLVTVSLSEDAKRFSHPFVLTIKNDLGDGLEVWLERRSQEEKSALYIIIGTFSALIVVLIINILAFYLRLRKAREKLEDTKPASLPTTSDTTYDVGGSSAGSAVPLEGNDGYLKPIDHQLTNDYEVPQDTGESSRRQMPLPPTPDSGYLDLPNQY